MKSFTGKIEIYLRGGKQIDSSPLARRRDKLDKDGGRGRGRSGSGGEFRIYKDSDDNG